MSLTERQKKDLNCAILEYMSQGGGQFSQSAAIFAQEANISDTSDFGKNTLEKKWSSIIRFQKRIMDLEAQVAELQKKATFSLDIGSRGGDMMNTHGQGGSSHSVTSGGTLGAGGSSGLIPRGPAKSTLVGHRLKHASINMYKESLTKHDTFLSLLILLILFYCILYVLLLL